MTQRRLPPPSPNWALRSASKFVYGKDDAVTFHIPRSRNFTEHTGLETRL